MFSIPLNPKLNEKEFFDLVKFCREHKEYIYDIYTTVRMPPFTEDAMGDHIDGDAIIGIIQNAIYLRNETGIPLSATFNNIMVAPTEENLDTFIEYFKPLYDAGIRIVTLPHTIWMLSGKIKKAYPDLYVKNTILRNVQRPNEVYELAKAGFDYINLDRDLMRDREKLLEIKRAKEQAIKDFGRDIKVSLLANEGCWGNCSVQDEHFEYNFTRKEANTPTYFYSNLSKVSCPLWDVKDKAVELKKANFPPWREDWVEFINDLGIDVIKMHGRESVSRLYETMDIIRRFARGDEILFDGFNEYIEERNLTEKPIDAWRKKIKSCGFNCWDCKYCEKVIAKRPTPEYIEHVNKSLANAIEGISKINKAKAINGLTSDRVKHLLNNLCSMDDARYIEVGTYQGATLLSAIEGNDVKAIAIDNWCTPEINPMRDMPFKIETDPKAILMKNLGDYTPTIIDSDIKNVTELPHKCNIFFYDGDHEKDSHYTAFAKVKPYLDEVFIAVIDDYNWTQVKQAMDFLTKQYDVLYKNEILTTGENPNDFWNGLGIFILKKKKMHESVLKFT